VEPAVPWLINQKQSKLPAAGAQIGRGSLLSQLVHEHSLNKDRYIIIYLFILYYYIRTHSEAAEAAIIDLKLGDGNEALLPEVGQLLLHLAARPQHRVHRRVGSLHGRACVEAIKQHSTTGATPDSRADGKAVRGGVGLHQR
jgi:hypothetical protein